MAKFEICVTSLQGVKAALEAGADRVELCSGLTEGGLTPSYALIKRAVEIGGDALAVNVLIRSRGGDFLYDADDLEMMLQDIEQAKVLGAKGVVIGALNADGTINESFLKEAVARAQGMTVTFHRAFDMCADLNAAAKLLHSYHVDYILTSGGEASAHKGMAKLRELNAEPNHPIYIAAAGVNKTNIAEIANTTKIEQFHFSAKDVVKSQMVFTNPRVHMGIPGADEYSNPCTNLFEIKATMQAIHN
ncbi:MAG: copper homeostasis protein CutC [Anaerobiospirillum succiniciproducens]|uniref:copper homeostasis protein CutC n=1 Tax=Anaerobiospirillum succiniciproducens TaxID=13335 RepID=UPI0026DC9D80|nr:copper homeostasis protein CutC [Anaerobiospirillum succiniciproducens]MDO4675315.1 copper homeostasis protein CutC [Anaerobiospirillum succiniciproducens]